MEKAAIEEPYDVPSNSFNGQLYVVPATSRYHFTMFGRFADGLDTNTYAIQSAPSASPSTWSSSVTQAVHSWTTANAPTSRRLLSMGNTISLSVNDQVRSSVVSGTTSVQRTQFYGYSIGKTPIGVVAKGGVSASW